MSFARNLMALSVSVLLLAMTNISFSAPLPAPECLNFAGETTPIADGRADLDLGLLKFSADFVAEEYKVCVEQQVLKNGPMKVNGWAFNSNLGWVSFRSEEQGGKYLNREIELGSKIEYGADLYPELTPQGVRYDLRGYVWGDNVGWIKLSCKQNPNLNYDADVCAGSNFGVSIVPDSEKNGLYALQGLAWSETFGSFINFDGVYMPLPLSNLVLKPKLRVVPVNKNKILISRDDILANGEKGYQLSLQFFDQDNVNRTTEFKDSGLDFCLIFQDNRKLSLNDDDQVENQDCDTHTQEWPQNLNNWNMQSFNFAANKFLSKKIVTSVVPSDTGFEIAKIKVFDGVNEAFTELNEPLDFHQALQFYLDTTSDLDNLPRLSECKNTSNNTVSYDWVYGENEFIYCVAFSRGGLSSYGLALSLDSNLQGATETTIYLPADPEADPLVEPEEFDFSGLKSEEWVQAGTFDVTDDGVGLQDVNLRLAGTLTVNFAGASYTRPLPDFGNYFELVRGINRLGVIKDRSASERNGNGFSMTMASSGIEDKIDKLRNKKFACNYLVPDYSECESSFVPGVYQIENSNPERAGVVRYSKLKNLLRNQNKVVMLRDLDLYIDENINFDGTAPGFVLLDSNEAPPNASSSNVFVNTNVTDVKAHIFTDGYIYNVIDEGEFPALRRGAFSTISRPANRGSLYNELAFMGTLKSKNCVECSQLELPRLPDGSYAEDNNNQALEFYDMYHFRYSPLEFKLINSVIGVVYADCETERIALPRIIYRSDGLIFNKACRRTSVAGTVLLESRILDGDVGTDILTKYSTNLIYKGPDSDLPIFGQ